jgi:uncharacterized protein (TIGR00369 family)
LCTNHIDNDGNIKGNSKYHESGARGRLQNTRPGAVAGHAARGSRSLPAMPEQSAESHAAPAPEPSADGTQGHPAAAPRVGGPRSLDGVSSFMGLRWDDAQTVRLTVRDELMNRGGLLSGVATYALVDYCMGSTLWAQTSKDERIATISISINYIQTATQGDVICKTELDRRNRSVGILKSEVRDEHGELMVTAVGSYSIRIPRELRQGAGEKPDTPPAR